MSSKYKQELDLVEHQVILTALDQIQIYGKDAKKIATLQTKLEKGFTALQEDSLKVQIPEGS